VSREAGSGSCGRTIACVDRPFDGMLLKAHGVRSAAQHARRPWAVGCLLLHVGLVGAPARRWPAPSGAVAGRTMGVVCRLPPRSCCSLQIAFTLRTPAISLPAVSRT